MKIQTALSTRRVEVQLSRHLVHFYNTEKQTDKTSRSDETTMTNFHALSGKSNRRCHQRQIINRLGRRGEKSPVILVNIYSANLFHSIPRAHKTLLYSPHLQFIDFTIYHMSWWERSRLHLNHSTNMQVIYCFKTVGQFRANSTFCLTLLLLAAREQLQFCTN